MTPDTELNPVAIDPRVTFEKRYACQAFEDSIDRGEPEILVRGGRGSGKTMFILHRLHSFALFYPNMVQVWLRWERSKMTETLLATFEDEILGLGHPLRAGVDRGNRKGYLYPNGSRIILHGLSDDPDLTKSMNADIFLFNEVGQVPERIWEEAGGAARKRSVGTFPYKLKIGDLNPMPQGHWTNNRSAEFPEHFYPRIADDGSTMPQVLTRKTYVRMQVYNRQPLDPKRHKTKLIQACIADNPMYWNFDPWGFRVAGFDYVTKQLGKMHPELKARYLEGRPTAQENVVYPEFSPRHIVKRRRIPRDWPCILAKDPGRDHKDVMIVVAISPAYVEVFDEKGKPFKLYKLYIVAEAVSGNASELGRGTTIEEDARIIDTQFSPHYRIIKKIGDPHMMFSATKFADTGKTIAQQFRRYGQVFVPAKPANNTEQMRAQCDLVRTYLTTIDHQGEPMLQVFEDCRNVINGFYSWGFARTKSGERKGGGDTFQDVNDDEMDTVRMVAADEPKFVEIPKIRVFEPKGRQPSVNAYNPDAASDDFDEDVDDDDFDEQ